jgi:acetyl esterase/lipase
MSHRNLTLALVVLVGCGSSPQHDLADAPPNTDHDGSTTSDAPSTTADPALDGTFAVTTQDVTISVNTRSAAATTFVPTSAPSPRPLVVVSPGFQMSRSQYTSYAHHLATWGMTVVLADYTDQGFGPSHQQLADDVQGIITWALAQSSLGADATKIATAGHSLGGKISLLVATDDPRVKAVVGWDPVDGGSTPTVATEMGGLTAAVAVIGETTDGSGGMACAPTANNFQTLYAAAHAPALQMTVPTADHMDWVDDPSCLFCSFCTAGTAPAELARTATKRLNVAWLRLQLLGDHAMMPWLAMPPEVGAGTATVTQK